MVLMLSMYTPNRWFYNEQLQPIPIHGDHLTSINLDPIHVLLRGSRIYLYLIILNVHTRYKIQDVYLGPQKLP